MKHTKFQTEKSLETVVNGIITALSHWKVNEAYRIAIMDPGFKSQVVSQYFFINLFFS